MAGFPVANGGGGIGSSSALILPPQVVVRSTGGPEFYDSYAPYVAKADGSLTGTVSDSHGAWVPFGWNGGLRIMAGENGTDGVLTSPRQTTPGQTKASYVQTRLKGNVARFGGRFVFPPWTGDAFQGTVIMLCPSADYASTWAATNSFLPTTSLHLAIGPAQAQLDFLLSVNGVSAVLTDSVSIFLSPAQSSAAVLQPNVEYQVDVLRAGQEVSFDITRVSDGASMLGYHPVAQGVTDAGVSITNTSPTVTDASINAADHGSLITGLTDSSGVALSGIPANTYVGTVTPGVSFLMSSSPSSQVNVNATASQSNAKLTKSGSQATIVSYAPVVVTDPRFASQAGPFVIWETFLNGNPDFTNGSLGYWTQVWADSSLQQSRDRAMSLLGTSQRVSQAITAVEPSVSSWQTNDGSSIPIPSPSLADAVSSATTLNGTTPTRAGVVTVTIASPGVFSKVAHGLTLNDAVIFTTTGALPTGLTAGTTYFVISTGLTADQFQVSATAGGSAVNTSGTQSGTHTVHPPLSMAVTVPSSGSGVVRVRIEAHLGGTNTTGTDTDVFLALRYGSTTYAFEKVMTIPAQVATTPVVPGKVFQRVALTKLLTGLVAPGFIAGTTYRFALQVKASQASVANLYLASSANVDAILESTPLP